MHGVPCKNIWDQEKGEEIPEFLELGVPVPTLGREGKHHVVCGNSIEV